MSVRQMTPVYKLRSTGIKSGEKHPDVITVYRNDCGEYFAKSVKHSEYVDIKGYTYMSDDVQRPKTPYSKGLAKKLALVHKYGTDAKITGYTVEEYTRKSKSGKKFSYAYETKIGNDIRSHATFEDAENYIKANGGIGILTATLNGKTKEYRYGEKRKGKKSAPAPKEWRVEIEGHDMLTKFFDNGDDACAYALKMRKERFSTATVYYKDKIFEIFEWNEPISAPVADPAEPISAPSSFAFSPTTADPAEPISFSVQYPDPTAKPANEPVSASAAAAYAASVKKKSKKKSSGRTVEQYATLLKMQTKENQGLGFFGPAGTGKTYTVYQIAEHMQVSCYLQGKVSHPSELSGFVDAMGNYHTTPLRTAFENGGILLIDEFDSWDSDVVVAINSAIASRKFSFADGKEIAAHEDLMFVFTANTQFGGCVNGYERSPMDISTINRAIWFKIDYDFELESELYGRELANFAKNAREVLNNENVIGIISMRNMAAYNNMIAAGFSKQDAIRYGLLSTINDTDCVNRLADMAEYSL